MTEVKRRRRRTAPAGIAPNEPERDILDQYLYEVSTYPLLKGTEEIDLARKIRAGDQDALQELVKRNLRFVISVAKKYQNRGLPLIDLIGEGNVGLLTAARKFDPDQGVKFISYAVWWIRQAILSSLARQGRTVRVPLNRTADLSRIIKASRDPAPEAAPRAERPRSWRSSPDSRVDVVQSLAALNTGDVRLDAPMDPDGDRSLIERFVADEMPGRRRGGDEPLPHGRDRDRRSARCRRATRRCCVSTSVSKAAASTRSRRSARCSASRASASASCATAPSSGSAKATSAGRSAASRRSSLGSC